MEIWSRGKLTDLNTCLFFAIEMTTLRLRFKDQRWESDITFLKEDHLNTFLKSYRSLELEPLNDAYLINLNPPVRIPPILHLLYSAGQDSHQCTQFLFDHAYFFFMMRNIYGDTQIRIQSNKGAA